MNKEMFELDNKYIQIIGEHLSINDRYLIGDRLNRRIFQFENCLSLNVQLINKNGKFIKSKGILNLTKETLSLSIDEKIRIKTGKDLSLCLLEIENIRDFIFKDIVKGRKITFESSNLTKINGDNEMYRFQQKLTLIMKKGFLDSLYLHTLNYLLQKDFKDSKKIDVNLKDLNMFSQLFYNSDSNILFKKGVFILDYDKQLKDYLNFNNLKEFNDINDLLFINYKI